MSRRSDHWLTTRTGMAFLLANARYWSTIAPTARAQLRRWREHAIAIPDPRLRQIALDNLREEGFNALATTTLAALAPRRHQPLAVNAIVALQVMYDYLDSIIEHPLHNPRAEGSKLYRAFTDAVTPARPESGDYYGPTYTQGDCRYLPTLVSVVRDALAQLPSYANIVAAATIAAERCAQAQLHAHTEPCDTAIKSWATAHAVGTDLGWREFLAGAVSSGLALHALIAAAADPRTSSADARAIDDLYLPICALTTLLDGLVDYDQDLQQMGHPGYIRFYDNDETLALAIVNLIQQASTRAPKIQHTGHHLLTLSGILAYYSSAPTANTVGHTKLLRASGKLGVLGTPTHAILTVWRYAEQTRHERARAPGPTRQPEAPSCSQTSR
jgi:tetraprenyl-beta-curcumene synthase